MKLCALRKPDLTRLSRTFEKYNLKTSEALFHARLFFPAYGSTTPQAGSGEFSIVGMKKGVKVVFAVVRGDQRGGAVIFGLANAGLALERRAIYRNQFCFSSGALGSRRLETQRAGRIWPNLVAGRLDRNTATPGAGRLDLGPNSPRQNDPDIRHGALKQKNAGVRPRRRLACGVRM